MHEMRSSWNAVESKRMSNVIPGKFYAIHPQVYSIVITEKHRHIYKQTTTLVSMALSMATWHKLVWPF